jgi:ComF family protein
MFREAVDALFSIFFPAPCRLCDTPLESVSRIPICRNCLESLRPLAGPACEHCGRPFPSAWAATVANPRCHACRRGIYVFDAARSYGGYDEPMVRAILLLKHNGVSPLGSWFAERLIEVVEKQPDLFAADVVVPVPLHASRQRERGYNQAELIARPLARHLRLPLRSYLLVRTRPRPDKLKLTRRERWTTVRGAYAVRELARIDKLHVLLVDDVFTTGATLDACARVLKRGGAASVVGLTVARVTSSWAAQPPSPRER